MNGRRYLAPSPKMQHPRPIALLLEVPDACLQEIIERKHADHHAAPIVIHHRQPA